MPRKKAKKKPGPIPTRLTPKNRKRFLELVRITGNVAYACAQIGISRQRMYDLRGEDKKLAKDWEEANTAGVESLEQEARRRAFSGVKRVDVSYDKDGKVRHRKVVTEYSDTLLIFLLKAHKPNKYRDVVRVESVDVSKLSDEELEALARGEVSSGTRIAPPATS